MMVELDVPQLLDINFSINKLICYNLLDKTSSKLPTSIKTTQKYIT